MALGVLGVEKTGTARLARSFFDTFCVSLLPTRLCSILRNILILN